MPKTSKAAGGFMDLTNRSQQAQITGRPLRESSITPEISEMKERRGFRPDGVKRREGAQ